jgi:hypothetical protein
MPDVRTLEELRKDDNIDQVDDCGVFIDDESSIQESSYQLGFLPQHEQIKTSQQQQEQQKHKPSDRAVSELESFFCGGALPNTECLSPTSVTNVATVDQDPNLDPSLELEHDAMDHCFVKLCHRTNSLPISRKSSLKRMPSSNSMSKSVSFSKLSVREYDISIGDNPSCSYGVPISLGWSFQQTDNLPLEESNCESRKHFQDMVLPHSTRHKLLKAAGYSKSEIKQALRQVNRIKRERSLTELFLAAAPLEDAVESVLGGVKEWWQPADI